MQNPCILCFLTLQCDLKFNAMTELKCPKCGAMFTVNEADYASILNQVKNDAFDAEVEKRLLELHKQHKAEQDAAILRSEQTFKDKLSAKDNELASKDTEIARLNERLNSIAQTKQLEMNEQLTSKDTEITRLKEQIAGLQKSKQLEIDNQTAEKDKRILELEAQLDQQKKEQKLAVMQEKSAQQDELQKKQQLIVELEAKLKENDVKAELNEKNLKDYYERSLKDKDEEIERYKDFKIRQSTKMIGEDLEVHCHNEFNNARSMGM